MSSDAPLSLEEAGARIAALEQQVRHLTEILPADTDDQAWCCLKCMRVLALDDQEANVIRVRMGGMLVMMSPGPGTWMQIVCPRCGHLNHADGPPLPADMLREMEAAAHSPGPGQEPSGQ